MEDYEKWRHKSDRRYSDEKPQRLKLRSSMFTLSCRTFKLLVSAYWCQATSVNDSAMKTCKRMYRKFLRCLYTLAMKVQSGGR